MKLRFTLRAVADIADIGDYLNVRNPRAADRVRQSIYQSLQLLISFPQIGRRQETEGVRKLITRRYGYLIYYRIDEAADEIIILSVKHPSRRSGYSDA